MHHGVATLAYKERKMSYPYKNRPPVDKIIELRSRIEVLEWEAISGDVPTWYAYEQINIMEQEIEHLQEVIHDALIPSTRTAG